KHQLIAIVAGATILAGAPVLILPSISSSTEIAAQFYAKNPQNPKHQKICDAVSASTHHPGMKKGSGCTIPGHQVTRGSASAGLPRARLNVAEMMGKFRLLELT